MRRMYSKNQLEELAKQTIENADSLQVFESIDDKDGHARFIEGNGTPLSLEGFNSVFCKWSLSGTHLMFVLAGSITANTNVNVSSKLAQFDLPEWVRNKIYPLFEGGFLIEYKTIIATTISYTQVNIPIYVDKNSTGIAFYNQSTIEESATIYFRMTCDLLIDNE